MVPKITLDVAGGGEQGKQRGDDRHDGQWVEDVLVDPCDADLPGA